MASGSENRPDFSEIGERLRKIREGFSDLKQAQWANKHNFSPTQWNNWEKGTRRITVDEAEKLARTYELSLDYIYRGIEAGLSENARKVL